MWFHVSFLASICCLITCFITFWKNRHSLKPFLVLFTAAYLCVLEAIVLLTGTGAQIVTLKILVTNIAVYLGCLGIAWLGFKKIQATV